jgi:hypothetical protein
MTRCPIARPGTRLAATFRQATLAVLVLATLILAFHVLGAPEWVGG